MFIYPAIDIKGGRCVRLLQGKAEQETRYYEDPATPAKQFQNVGSEWVHVVDLDGAFEGIPVNLDAIKRIVDHGMRVELGGGMRDFSQVEAALSAGVERVIIGTRACEDPDFVAELIQKYGPKHIAVGIDAKDGFVAVKGWVETSKVKALDLARDMESIGVSHIIYTDISRDGMLAGPNFEAQETMLRETGLNLIASGGVSSNDDIVRFAKLSMQYPRLDGVIIGKAIYEGSLDLALALKQAHR